MSEELLLSIGVSLGGTTIGLAIGLVLRAMFRARAWKPESRDTAPGTRSPAPSPVLSPPAGTVVEAEVPRSSPASGAEDPMPLAPIRVLDVFVVDRLHGRFSITREAPLRGELFRDASGTCFLSPEEDERGHGTGSLEVFGLDDPEVLSRTPCVVDVTGIFDSTRGLEIETVSRVESG